MFVEKKVVIAEMLSAHVPVEVLGLEVKSKGVGYERVQYAGKVLHVFGRETVWNEKPGRCVSFSWVCVDIESSLAGVGHWTSGLNVTAS